MPHITLKHPEQPVSEFSVSGAVVTVAGVSVDCTEHQDDVAVIVEIRGGAEGPAVGGSGAYLAQIHIPPRQYTEVEVPAEDDGEPSLERRAEPLDPNAVEIVLWPAA
jgi:hypothetical protein